MKAHVNQLAFKISFGDFFWDPNIKNIVFDNKAISNMDVDFVSRILELRRQRHSLLFMLQHSKEKEKLICAEIGTWVGENALIMLRASPKIKLYTIDDYGNATMFPSAPVLGEVEAKKLEQQADDTLRLYNGYRRIKIKKPSQEAYKLFPDEFFDYIYLDADHLYEAVKLDLRAWYPKLKKGGVFGGHDWFYAGVTKAVEEFVDEIGLGEFYCDSIIRMNTKNKYTLQSGYSDWWWKK